MYGMQQSCRSCVRLLHCSQCVQTHQAEMHNIMGPYRIDTSSMQLKHAVRHGAYPPQYNPFLQQIACHTEKPKGMAASLQPSLLLRRGLLRQHALRARVGGGCRVPRARTTDGAADAPGAAGAVQVADGVPRRVQAVHVRDRGEVQPPRGRGRRQQEGRLVVPERVQRLNRRCSQCAPQLGLGHHKSMADLQEGRLIVPEGVQRLGQPMRTAWPRSRGVVSQYIVQLGLCTTKCGSDTACSQPPPSRRRSRAEEVLMSGRGDAWQEDTGIINVPDSEAPLGWGQAL